MDGNIGALDFSGCDALGDFPTIERFFWPAQIGQCAFLHTLNLSASVPAEPSRGLHSSTSQLNQSRFCH